MLLRMSPPATSQLLQPAKDFVFVDGAAGVLALSHAEDDGAAAGDAGDGADGADGAADAPAAGADAPVGRRERGGRRRRRRLGAPAPSSCGRRASRSCCAR